MNDYLDELDELDLKIISHLQEDGRKSFSVIAEDVGVTERTVRLRVGQLRDRKILQIVGVVNPIKLGLQVVAIIQLAVQEAELANCVEQLRALEEVRFITMTSGEYQLLIQVVSRSYEDLVDFLQNKLNLVQGVRNTNTMVELQVFKNDFHFARSALTDPKSQYSAKD